ncbi:MAG: beta-propeller domain-containing protein [Epsilonproteobacteria bacterium]|nr:beta-propeller domain-containing protein [Campylobacterota bacterium]
MRKILLITLLFSSILLADSVLLLKKGWQLIGSSTAIEDLSKFTTQNVEQVWHYDATAQQWLGYSPDATIQAKINDQNISKLTTLKNWHGFWVKSKENWALTLPSTSLSSAPSNENSANDTIELKEGWNLISLPVDTVLSADIFEGMTVWKYNPNQEWELFDEQQTQEDFPRLGHIKNSDGIWVKASTDTNISVMQEASKLHNFTTTEEMEAYIKEMATIYQRPYCGIEPLIMGTPMVDEEVNMAATMEDSDSAPTPAPTSAPIATPQDTNEESGAKDATGTNLQESDVDESDIVKHDGTNIFYTSKENYQNNQINITSFSELASGNTQAVHQITFEDNRYIDSLYLVNNRLVVLSNIYGDYTIAEGSDTEIATSMPYPDSTQQILVDIFDVSDIENINNISSTKVDGNMVTSRVVGDNLYLVSNFTPQFTIEYPKVYVEASETCKEYFDNPYEVRDYSKYAECYNLHRESDTKYYRYDYDNPSVTITDLTPEIESSSMAKQALITPSKLYAPAKHQQSATMTTISNISISDGSYKQSNSFMGYSSVQYASSKAFYLVSNQYPIYYDFNNYKERSNIYKFTLDSGLNYKGIGSVYGYALNQFALSEYSDILRIATTEGFSWGSSGTNNSIYTLKEQDALLTIQGVLSGLGKEGETIKSVRFMGDKGYVVTFRQTDPLYTIDLSDPTLPQKVGELEVNGYSAYLHPVGDDKLLGIGRDADSDGVLQGLKIELFDISDFGNPTSLDSIIYSSSTSSEVEYNHKALAYRSSDDLFAFPYRSYGDYTTDYKTSNFLGIYQIKEDDLVAYDAIDNPNSNGWGEHRGLIFDMNETTYVSFFAGDTVITEELNTSTAN